jgi:hypothetical protein
MNKTTKTVKECKIPVEQSQTFPGSEEWKVKNPNLDDFRIAQFILKAANDKTGSRIPQGPMSNFADRFDDDYSLAISKCKLIIFNFMYNRLELDKLDLLKKK